MIFGDLKHDPIRVFSSLRPMNMTTRGTHFFLQSRQIHVHVFDGVQANIRAHLAQLFPLGKLCYTRRTPAYETLGRLLDGGGNTGWYMLAVFFKVDVGWSFGHI